jgi:hypothetical protein
VISGREPAGQTESRIASDGDKRQRSGVTKYEGGINMQITARTLTVGLLAFWLFAACPNLPADNITMLPLVNPGFDSGNESGWTRSNEFDGPVVWKDLGVRRIWAQNYADWLLKGWGCTFTNQNPGPCTYDIKLSQTQPVAMPLANDVRWAFWVGPFAYPDGTSKFFTATLGPLQFRLWGVGAPDLVPTKDYHWDFLAWNGSAWVPDDWASVTPTGSNGYYIRTHNLNDWLTPGATYPVQYEIWGQIGESGPGSMLALVSDHRPMPEPSGFLLFGSGLLGLAGFLRRKFMI